MEAWVHSHLVQLPHKATALKSQRIFSLVRYYVFTGARAKTGVRAALLKITFSKPSLATVLPIGISEGFFQHTRLTPGADSLDSNYGSEANP